MGLTGLGDHPPKPLEGRTQRAVTAIPDVCPKCRRGGMMEFDGRMVWCRGVRGGCGWTGALVTA